MFGGGCHSNWGGEAKPICRYVKTSNGFAGRTVRGYCYTLGTYAYTWEE